MIKEIVYIIGQRQDARFIGGPIYTIALDFKFLRAKYITVVMSIAIISSQRIGRCLSSKK